jgi:hypothetical protein
MLICFIANLLILLPFDIFCGHLVYLFLSILLPFGIFCGRLVYFVAIWYILWSFGAFSPVLVCCIKENLATLQWTKLGSKAVHEKLSGKIFFDRKV